MKAQYTGLVGDVGGTNARFGLIDAEGRVRNLHIYPAASYATLNDIIAELLGAPPTLFRAPGFSSIHECFALRGRSVWSTSAQMLTPVTTRPSRGTAPNT